MSQKIADRYFAFGGYEALLRVNLHPPKLGNILRQPVVNIELATLV
jgi:hypothetical protein